MQTEIIQTRIETYTASLPQAVQGGGGAQFGFLLSLIASNQERTPAPSNQEATGGGNFSLPQTLSRYPDPNSLFSDEVVGRLNQSVNKRLRGEFAYLVSYLDIRAHTPQRAPLRNDHIAQMGLASLGGKMLAHIEQARSTLQAVA